MSGSIKHNITLSAHDETGPFLKDLSDALTEVTGVPQTSQKIIFKGISHFFGYSFNFEHINIM